jgi:hypothetical protein
MLKLAHIFAVIKRYRTNQKVIKNSSGIERKRPVPLPSPTRYNTIKCLDENNPMPLNRRGNSATSLPPFHIRFPMWTS